MIGSIFLRDIGQRIRLDFLIRESIARDISVWFIIVVPFCVMYLFYMWSVLQH